jgi:putative NADH-flavin reductase
MKLLVLGATGPTGRLLVQQAADAGHAVTVLVRDPARATGLAATVVVGDATVADDVRGALRGQDAVLSTLGPRNATDAVRSRAAAVLVAAMRESGVRRLVWISASGVADSRPQAVASSFVFGRVILPLFLRRQYADAALAEQTIIASDLEWVVVRPVQLVEHRPRAAAIPDVAGGKLPVLKVARADVASFMLEQLTHDAWVGKLPVLHG